MSIVTPRTMPGVMELLPREQMAFQRLLDTIRKGYESFGFVPIETPVMEYVDILLTKSGGETERQVYFTQSSGAREQGHDLRFALRFDLTVPLARYVAEHESSLTFPFRRYQMQRVYRGESAQRGRFREFYQCDIDVIGKDSLSIRYDAEIPAVIYRVFSALNFGAFTINVNNRKLLTGLFEELGVQRGEPQVLILREIDKMDKRGQSYVEDVLTNTMSLGADVTQKILRFITLSGSNDEILDQLKELGGKTETYRTGLDELTQIVTDLRAFGVPESAFKINVAIARGLDYYTGTVYETFLNDHPEIGSVCSGGRFDNLAEHYTKSKLPGVGISIGATRLFYQLKELGLIQNEKSTTSALVALFDPTLYREYSAIATQLRDAGVATEMFLEPRKLGKQLKYAERQGIRYVVIVGPEEYARRTANVKDLQTSTQTEVPLDVLAETLKEGKTST